MPKQVTVKINGRPLTGWYRVKKKVITVSSMLGQKSTQLGTHQPEVLAKALLTEIVEGGKVKEFQK